MSGNLQDRLDHLVGEEHTLRDRSALSDDDRMKLEAIRGELNECWDLFRLRQAQQEIGDDPDAHYFGSHGEIDEDEP